MDYKSWVYAKNMKLKFDDIRYLYGVHQKSKNPDWCSGLEPTEDASF